MHDRNKFHVAGKLSGAMLPFLFFIVSGTFAQSGDGLRTEKTDHVIHSRVLGEDRKISVYEIFPGPDANPVAHTIYLLDGNDEFDKFIIGKLGEFLQENEMAGINLVTIENTDRIRDMSPVKTSFCDNPGASLFLECLQDEIIPYTESIGLRSPRKILMGQSYSAVFACYAFLTKPGLFDGYVATSLYFPQLEEFFLGREHPAFTSPPSMDSFLFISRGAEDHDYNKDGVTERALDEFVSLVKTQTAENTHLHYRVYEDHGHCPEPSYMDGIQWIIQEMGRE